MNRKLAKELLPIITAFAEGKTVQLRNGAGVWEDIETLNTVYPAFYFRIKPEPRVFYVQIATEHNNMYFPGTELLGTETGYKHHHDDPALDKKWEYIKVVEDISE